MNEKNKKYHILFSILFILTLLFSCKASKHVPYGEFLLKDVKIKSDRKEFKQENTLPFVTQQPNFKTFKTFAFPLFVYNLSGQNSDKWINRTLRNAGEAPVIFDSLQMEKTVVSLSRMAINKGYLDATVTTDLFYKNKEVEVTYNIDTKKPYYIENFILNLPDSVFVKPDSLIITGIKLPDGRQSLGTLDEAILKNKIINDGEQFSLDYLNNERTRITNFLRSCGYYTFSEEYLAFEVDTVLPDNKVNIETIFYKLPEKQKDGITAYKRHRQYIVKEVNFNLDYDPYDKNKVSENPSLIDRNDYHINYGDKGIYLKPHMLLAKTYIKPNELYNENLTSETYSGLSQLHILKNVNISYKVINNDLVCTIVASSQKRQEITVGVDGTNSEGFLGVGSELGYKHRNLFKRSEEFRMGLKGEYEMVTPNFTKFDDNYFELGVESSLSIPRFMLPGLKKETRRSLAATSQLVASYTYQRRPGYFSRNVFSTNLNYKWHNRLDNSNKHRLNLIDINYVRVPELDSIFSAGLSVAARKYSFSDQFIIGTGYSFSKTNANQVNKWEQPVYNLNFSAETAGNTLYLLSKIANLPKEDDNVYKIFGTKYAQFIRGTFSYSRTILIGEGNSVAWRTSFGFAYPYGNFQEVPIQKRFFAGGANSVRGWSVRSLGPGSFRPVSNSREFNNFFYHSGDLNLDINFEYRSKLIWLLESALFLDFGNIWTIKHDENRLGGQFKFNDFYKEIAAAWGFGFRLDFEYFLLRLDVGFKAYNPEKSGGEPYEKVNHWPITQPYKFSKNSAIHIAVGYPF